MGLKETRKKAMALMIAACMAGTSTTPVMAADLDTMFTDGAQDSLEQNNLSSSGENSNVSRTVNYKFKMPDGSFVSGGSFVTDKFTIQGSELAEIIEGTIPQGYQLRADKFYTLGFGPGSVDLYFDLIEMETKDIAIYYYSSDENKIIKEATVTVEGNVDKLAVADLELPEGYVVDETASNVTDGYIQINDGNQVQIVVKKAAKDIAVYYYSSDENKIIKEATVTVEGNVDKLAVADLELPEGYVLDETASNVKDGYIQINPGNQVQVVLKKTVNTKTTFYFIFKTEDGKTVGFDTAEFSSETYNINYNDLQKLNMVPEGYELCNSGDLCIDGATDKNNPVIVEVRKVEKEISIIYQTRAGKVVKTDTISVAADAIHINTSLLQAPTGYTIAIVGDLAITKDNKVYVTLDVAQKTISIVYKTLNGNIVKNQNMTVGYYTKYINADKLNAPSGYEIVSSGKLKITNNTVNVFVKAINKTITVYYKTSPTKVVKTEQLKVPGTAKKISVANLNLPKNYRLATNAKTFVIKKGDYVNVPVKLDTRKDVNTLRITCGKIFVYTGKAITPSVTIKDSWKTLKLGKDYTISYRNNIKRGKATIIVKGIGNYKGQKVLSFLIR